MLARSLGRLFMAIGFVTLLVILTPLVSWWAEAYAGSLDQPGGDVLILLSAAGDDHGAIAYSSYWRARQAVVAWQTGQFRTIILSGDSGPGILNFLAASGIPRASLVSETHSTSTHENAVETARLVQGFPGKKVLLTSDFHMYRALRAFRKQGVEVAPMVAPDVLHSSENWYGRFPAFQTMLVETVKIAYYRLRGWI